MQFACAVGIADVNHAVTNGLFEAGEFFDRLDAADHKRPRGFFDWGVAFGFKSDTHVPCVKFFVGDGPRRVGAVQKSLHPLARNKHVGSFVGMSC